MLKRLGAAATAPADDDGGPAPTVASRFAYNGTAYIIVLSLGFGMLAPWNIILNAIPYFQQQYTAIPNCISFYLTASYIYPQMPLLFLLLRYGNKLSFHARVVSSLLIQVVALILLPILVPHFSSVFTTLSLIFIVGLTTAVLQISVFGLVSMLPPVFSQAVMAGQGISGVVAGVAELIVKAALPNKAATAATAYFAFAAICLLVCTVGFIYLMTMPFVRYHLAKAGVGDYQVVDDSPGIGSVDDPSDRLLSTPRPGATGKGGSSIGDDLVLNGHSDSFTSAALSSAAADASVFTVLRKVWPMATAVFFVFFVTFLVFPSVAPAGIHYKGTVSSWHVSDDWWIPIMLLVFNIFDTVGRSLTARIVCCRGYVLTGATLLRFLVVPIFLGCARNWAPGFNDAVAIITMAIFAVTNGYMASIAMMLGPTLVDGPEKEKAGFLMSLSLQLGILAGSQAAFGFTGGPASANCGPSASN